MVNWDGYRTFYKDSFVAKNCGEYLKNTPSTVTALYNYELSPNFFYLPGEMRAHMKEYHSDHEKQTKRTNAMKASIKALKQSESSSSRKETLNFLKSFKCPMCPVSYVREDSLRSHIRVHQRARNGQKGIVVVDTSMLNEEDPDDPEETPPGQPAPPTSAAEPLTVSVLDPGATSTQQVVFYVPSDVNPEPQDPLLLSPNSGNNLLEQLNLQQGVQYILVPSSATEGFETQVEAQPTFQQ